MTQIDENKLLPCPFCGSEDLIINQHEDIGEGKWDEGYYWDIECNGCDLIHGDIEQWNTRTPRTITREEFAKAVVSSLSAGIASIDKPTAERYEAVVLAALETLGITVEGV